ncbi:MAG: acyl-CoA thioesterase [Byssovorax sp.]
MIAFDRPIKFEEVDAAGIVFFARYLNYAHEAMERFFGELEGGYAHLIMGRRVGFPAVEVKIAFTSPMRYGDVLRIETRVSQLGNRSATFHYRMLHRETGALAAEIFHKVVVSDLVALKSCEMPPELRALLAAHQEPAIAST